MTVGDGVVVVSPGDTVIFATQDTVYFQGETVIPKASASQGAARILATS